MSGPQEVRNVNIDPECPIRAFAQGQRGANGAHNRYVVWGFTDKDGRSTGRAEEVVFQEGSPITEGYNGLTMEALLAIAIHRLDGLQEGPLPTEVNALARAHIEAAIELLHDRTRDRIDRNVVGRPVE